MLYNRLQKTNLSSSASRVLNNNQGFTLLELLTVMAISSVLLGLLMYPLYDSFRITKRTQVAVRSQTAARTTLEQVTREVQSAIFVYDNTGQAIRIPLQGPPAAPSLYYDIPHAMVNLVPAKVVMHCNDPGHPANQPRNFARGNLAWPSCPIDGSTNVEARPMTPPEPEVYVVRYFVGLLDPTQPYNPAYTNNKRNPGTQNPFVLYRAEFNPQDENLIDNTGGVNGFTRADFFYNSNSAPNGLTFAQNWKRIAKTVGPVNNVDLVTIRPSLANPQGVSSAVRFVPNTVSNDVLTPTEAGRTADGEPNSPPTVYRATRGQWAPNFQVRLYRDNATEVYYTTYQGSDLVLLDGSNSLVFNISEWVNNKTLSPSNPRLMLRVDPNKGEVSFAFPMPVEIWDNADVISINDTMRNAPDDVTPLRAISLSASGRGLASLLGASNSARVVPGSDRVFGPDWTPGANYGKLVQYSRVSALMDDPGPNEYRIDYQTGEIYFYSLPFPAMPEKDADGNDAAGLEVHYSVQNNRGFDTAQGDVISADYITKDLMSVHISYRIFNDEGRPMQLALSNNVLVRNFHR